jgi:hypothetical protein
MGNRPKLLMNEKIKQFLEMFTNYPVIEYACAKVGITRQTYYNWLKKNKKFKKQVEEILKGRNEILEDVMMKTALKGNPTMQIFLACNWMPEKYRNIQKVDIEGKNIISVKIEPFKKDEKE